MNIVFYISNHGFGHIMRNLPVMEELVDRGHKITLITGKQQASVVKDTRIRVLVEDTDAGLIVKPGTILLDENKTAKRVSEHIKRWPDLIKSAPNADIYVVDIVPWALLAAKNKGIPSYFMASFTWIEQYEPFLSLDFINQYKEAFKCTDSVLYYDLTNAPTKELLGDGVNVGFVTRQITDKVEEIRLTHHKPIVYFSLGGSNNGLDDEIDVSTLPYDFITTSAMHLKGYNVTRLGIDVDNTQDYVAAADYCIAKAGWSTVAEMMVAGVKFAVLNRPGVPEDTMIIEELEKRKAGFGINISDLQNIDQVINRLNKFERQHDSYTNNYKIVADIIEGKQHAL